MAVQLNHTIVASHDKHASAAFLAGLLGLSQPVPFGHFVGVEVANGVTLDFDDARGVIVPQHYAFLVDDDDFDDIFDRIEERNMRFWADPGRTREGEINTRDGGRGVYFEDPNGHLLEILTRPYGNRG